MSIIFEPYTLDTAIGAVRLPFGVYGADFSGSFGHVAMPFGVTGATGTTVSPSAHGAVTLPFGVFGTDGATFGHVKLPFGIEGSASSLVAPEISIGSVALPFGVKAHAYTISAPAQGSMALPFNVFATDAANFGHLALPLGIRGQEVAPSRFANLYQFPWVESNGHQGIVVAHTETLTLGAADDAQHVLVRADALGVHIGNTQTMLDGLSTINEHLTFHEVAQAIWQVLHTEALILGGDGALIRSMLVRVAEKLALAAGGASLLDGLSTVVEALHLGAEKGYTWPVDVLESLALGADDVATLLAANRVTEMLALSGSDVGYATFSMLVPETLVLGDAASTTAELFNQINEGVTFLARFSLPNGEYLAWVCNAQTRAFTSYRNFPFNSFCEIGGRYYGATDTGIYELAGDDDAGEPIAARIRTGLMDLGVAKLKRAESMYLGYRATGDLVLKVVTTSAGGEKNESWYALQPRPAADLREGRVKIGKGLKSLYWGFEIANVDGADFELDSISLLPLILERKI